MVSKFSVGSQAFIIESNLGGGIQVRASRLFVSKEDAERALPERYKPKIKIGFRSPYDYGL